MGEEPRQSRGRFRRPESAACAGFYARRETVEGSDQQDSRAKLRFSAAPRSFAWILGAQRTGRWQWLGGKPSLGRGMRGQREG